MTFRHTYPAVIQVFLMVIALLLIGVPNAVALSTEERIENLELLLSRVKLEEVDGKMSYIFGPESCTLPDGTPVSPCGVNVYVRNGSGDSSDMFNGLGNIIIGSNRPPAKATPLRNATHSIIVGEEHEYLISSSALFGYQHNIIGGVMGLKTGRGHFSVNGAAVGTSIIGGIEHEIISASLNTIMGGAQHISAESFCSLLGGFRNFCNAQHSQAVGGKHNRVDAEASTIGGGYYNEISPTGIAATIIGGELNIAEGPQCSVFGGTEHHIYLNGVSSAISGGELGRVHESYSSISGGLEHDVKGAFSSIAGGQYASFDVLSEYSVSLGSSSSKVDSYYNVALGGDNHSVGGYYSVVYGGYGNSTNGDYSVIVNGNRSVSRAKISAMLGGGESQSRNITGISTNPNVGSASVILGGSGNNTTGNYCSLGRNNGRVQSIDYSYDL